MKIRHRFTVLMLACFLLVGLIVPGVSEIHAADETVTVTIEGYNNGNPIATFTSESKSWTGLSETYTESDVIWTNGDAIMIDPSQAMSQNGSPCYDEAFATHYNNKTKAGKMLRWYYSDTGGSYEWLANTISSPSKIVGKWEDATNYVVVSYGEDKEKEYEIPYEQTFDGAGKKMPTDIALDGYEFTGWVITETGEYFDETYRADVKITEPLSIEAEYKLLNSADAKVVDFEDKYPKTIKGNCNVKKAGSSGGTSKFTVSGLDGGLRGKNAIAYCMRPGAASPTGSIPYTATRGSIKYNSDGSAEATYTIEIRREPIAAVGSGWGYQLLEGKIKVKANAGLGEVQITKKSSNTAITSGNDCYSFAGAKFGIYDKESCSDSSLIGSITIKPDGKGTLADVPQGTYYVREFEGLTGKNYAWNKKVYEAVVKANKTTEVSIENIPQNDPVIIMLRKVDVDTGEPVPQGNAKLAGARFVVEYYDEEGIKDDGTFRSLEATGVPLKADGTGDYKRRWVFETDEDGDIVLDDPSYQVSGGALYKAMDGKTTVFPIGTYIIYESKAPEGYLKNEHEYFLRNVTVPEEGSSVEDVKSYNRPISRETPKKGGIIIRKNDQETGINAQGGATFKGAEFSIINDSEESVSIDGKETAPGKVCKKITTDENGVAQTTADCFPYGDYIIRETGAPTGYLGEGVTERKFSITKDGEMIDLTSTPMINPVIRGGVKINKTDQQTDKRVQGNATFSGAEFSIINNNDQAVKVDGKMYAKGTVCKVITTNSSGLAQTASDSLPYGKYIIKETKAPTGYLNKGTIERSFSITKDGVIVDLTSTPIINPVIRGGVKINKTDQQTDLNVQGDATFAGAEFSIINDSDSFVMVDGATYEPGKVCKVITTNSSGLAQTAANSLPYGDYIIKETKAPTGYLNKGTIERKFTISQDGVIVDLTSKPMINPVIRGGVQIQKWDKELNKPEALGGANHSAEQMGAKLTGIEFTITNKSKAYVIVEGKEYQPGEVITKLKTAWNEAKQSYTIQTPSDYLPYGTYTIQETKTNDSYLLTDGAARTFTIREEGKIVTANTAGEALTFKNYVVRGDIELQKITSEGSQSLSVPFVIENMTTGEKHVAVTDSNGNLKTASSWNKHSNKTNANDKLLEMTDISASDLDYTAGIWFSLGENGSHAAVDDSKGALPYGKYKITEMLTEENQAFTLQSWMFSISREGKVVDLGTVTNAHVTIETEVRDIELDSRRILATGDVELEDVVTYEGLTIGEEYTLFGKLVDKESGEPIVADEETGEIVTGETTFTATQEDGSERVYFAFDASELAGHEIVVFEELQNSNGATIAFHEDLTDAKQTMTFVEPELDSHATNDITGKQVAYPAPSTTINDTIEYSGVLSRMEYVLHYQLVDADTGEPIVINGREIKDTRTFYSNTTSGKQEVSLTFDATGFEGRTVTMVSYLTWNGYTVAEHLDNGDEDQQVHFPIIDTNAIDDKTQDHISLAEDKVKIIDKVQYQNVFVGYEYKLLGQLIDKSNGMPVMKNGEPVTAETVFTPDDQRGPVDVVFEFDASDMEGETVVVYETLMVDEHTIAIHHELGAENQTIHFPKIRTTAVDSETKHHIALADDKVKIIDTVKYENVLPDKDYTIKGCLMNQETGENITNDGEAVEASATFTAEKAYGKVEVVFELDASEYEGYTSVAFEQLYFGDTPVAIHEDIEDEEQAVHFPKVRSQCIDDKTFDHIALAEDKASLTDTIMYENMLVGERYEVQGTLMNSTTGETIMDDGEPVTGTARFIPEEEDGEVQVTFEFDASDLKGETAVAFQNVYFGKHIVGRHCDIADELQSVHFPKVLTAALDGETDVRMAHADKNVTITDEVTYNNVLPDEEYTVVGKLMLKDEQRPLLVDGKEVTASTSFTSNDPNGRTNVTFQFDATGLDGKDVVVFETLYYKGNIVGLHTDINDRNQTIHFPKVRTTATDKVTENHVALAGEEAVFTDTVKYENVLADKEYTITGTLMDAETGETLDNDGEPITSSVTFTAKETSGTEEVVFTFDASDFSGKTAVVYERLYWNGHIVGSHTKAGDKSQQVNMPKIRTTALDSETKDHIALADDKAIITDTVEYDHLLEGKTYTMQGLLVNQANGVPIIIDDAPVIVEKEFTAEKSEGTVDVVFEIDASELKNTTVTVYESLFFEGHLVGHHYDIDDTKQQIQYPEIITTALDSETNEHMAMADNDVTIVDRVEYRNVLDGEEYTMTGKLMLKSTGEPVKVDGKEVTATQTFTADERDGFVDLTFKFDGSELAGETVVAFEELLYKNVPVGEHKDIESEAQSIKFPGIKTTALDSETEKHVSLADDKVTIVDTVKYRNVLADKEYTVTGKLMDKATGKPYMVNGEEITASTTFTAEDENGEAKVTFEFDATGLEGTATVAFEQLYWDSHLVAIHEDIEDREQAVHLPKIKTQALGASSKGHMELGNKDTSIVDTVKYENLRTEETYTMVGTLMDVETGEPIKVKGKNVTAETEFTAEKENDSVKVKFDFDATELRGKTVVVYEELKIAGKTVALHCDLTDREQQVQIPKISTSVIDADTETRISNADGDITLIDTVAYENLIIGEKYEVKGILMDKSTGKPLTDAKGKEITAKANFTAKDVNGSVEVTFKFSGKKLGGATCVVFEDLLWNGAVIAQHHDIEDKAQTVQFPGIKTTAVEKESGKKLSVISKSSTIVDTVEFTNLVPGEEYVLSGQVINKTNGKPMELKNAQIVEIVEEPSQTEDATDTEDIVVEGDESAEHAVVKTEVEKVHKKKLTSSEKSYTTEMIFVPEKPNGTVKMELTIDSSNMAKKSAVVFETVSLDGKIVAEHKDINSKDQTVSFATPATVKTYDRIPLYVTIATALVVLSLLGIYISVRRKRAE